MKSALRTSPARVPANLLTCLLSALALPSAIALWSAAAYAQTEPAAPVQLNGTLAKVRNTGSIIVAYRESSVPFSFLNSKGEPIGYSIELCKKLVDAVSQAVDKEVSIKWVPVTTETRIDAIASGKADLECGSTTSNVERQKIVGFSPTMFVSGTKLMVKTGSPIKSFRDLQGKTVVVTAATTNEKAMRDLAQRFKLDYKITVARDHAESFAEVESGRADAFATDDVLLYGLIAQNKAKSKYQVIGEFLSYDPYGIMYRRGDPQMAQLVNDTFHDLAEDGEIERQYKRWFLRRLPSGDSLDLTMSPQLETIVRAMASKPEE
jgi:ABC-type amino acid transport substrate-binding protein